MIAVVVASLVALALVTRAVEHARRSSDRTSAVSIEETVDAGKIRGSGVLLPGRLVLTAAHVASAPIGSRVEVSTQGGQKTTAAIVWRDEELDVALLHLDATETPGVAPSRLSCRPPTIGEEVETVGNPLGYAFVRAWGRVSRVLTPRSDDPMEARTFVVDMTAAPGSSGGPVYDSSGDVIGLVDAVAGKPGYSLFPITFVVPSSLICDAIAQNKR